MANSESEDFESADEGITKNHVNKTQPSMTDDTVSTTFGETVVNTMVKSDTIETNAHDSLDESNAILASGAGASSQSDISGAQTAISRDAKLAEAFSAVPQDSSKISAGGETSSSTLQFNPDSLGAKPKVFQKGKSKSHSKHKGHRLTPETGPSGIQNTSNTNNFDTNQRRRSGSAKLGIKIEPLKILSNETMPSDFAFKEKIKPKVTWGGDTSSTNADNMDLHDSIQPLLDKLASLDVVETPDQGETSAAEKVPSSWGIWGNWGMNTIISGASSVSSHVTQGLSTVSSVIESGLGAVDPQEMARISLEANNKEPVEVPSNLSLNQDSLESPNSGLNVMGNVLKFVESTGEMIVSSGLNTLESIGKKTMDVLQEGDPGLKKKRAMFLRDADKPTLSQVLKEAKIKAEAEDQERVQAKKSSRAHFETLFDDYRGMIHLEALEMLSNTCQLKLEAKRLVLSGAPLVEFQRLLLQVKEQCDIPDDEDEDEEDRGSIEILDRDLSAAMRGLLVPISHSKLLRVSEETDSWLATMRCMQDEDSQNENDEWVDEEDISEDADPQSALRDIHQQAIRSLARFTAAVAEHFHKTAELLLLKEEHNSPVECHCIVMMTSVLCSRVSSVAARFSELLSASANMLDSTQVDHNDVNLLITNVFLEASNSSSYIQDASLLLIPVLQLGAVQ